MRFLFLSAEGDGGTKSERFLSVLDVRRQMAKIKDSLRSSVVENSESDDTELFSGVKTQRLEII